MRSLSLSRRVSKTPSVFLSVSNYKQGLVEPVGPLQRTENKTLETAEGERLPRTVHYMELKDREEFAMK